MPKNPIDYANGLQYKIVCNDPSITDCYNGSCVSFKDRKKRHKSCCTNPNSDGYNYKVYQFIREHGGWANWTMIQLELYPCKSEQELRLREREIFDILKPTLNMISPTADLQKRKKCRAAANVRYNANHKDEIKNRQDEYNATHKKEKHEFYEKNKVTILVRQREYHHLHKEERLIRQREYDASRREITLAKINCECGCVTTKHDLSRHKKSNKHLALMAKK